MWNVDYKKGFSSNILNNQQLRMSQSMAARKMNLQKTQIRSILNDYRKAKQKCITLANEINEEFQNKVHFDSVERETSLKMELLGINQLVQMKNTLVNTLSELFDLQNDLNTKKQRLEARKSFKQIPNSPKNAELGTLNFKKNVTMHQIDAKYNQKGGAFDENPKPKPRPYNFNVPVYRVKDDTNENKVDRLSKYVASLKRNMKQHCNQTGGKKIKDMLFEEPQFLKVKEELERYKMREEELLSIMDRKIQKGIEEAIKNASLLEQTRQYKILKFNKTNKKSEKTADQSSHSSHQETTIKLSSLAAKKQRQEVKQAEQQKKTEQRGLENKKDNNCEDKQIKQDSVIESVMQKISSTMGNSEVKLKELREQRKKIFLDEDVWNQFQQI